MTATTCTAARLEARRARSGLGAGHAIVYADYRRNHDDWRDPSQTGGAPVYLDGERLWSYAGGGGTVWVVVGRVLEDGSKHHSLAYRLADCDAFVAGGSAAKRFGACGVRGNAAQSSWFASNDVTDLLMALRFKSRKAIPARADIGQRLRGSRPLGEADVEMLQGFAKRLSAVGALISYAHEDRSHAVTLKDRLERAGISVFRDEESIVAGERWREALESAIEAARALVVLCSDAAARSRWVRHEIAAARARLARGSGPPLALILVLLPGAHEEPWRTLLSTYHAVRWEDTRLVERIAQAMS